MTDDEIRAAILSHFEVELLNFGGDTLFEGPCDGNEDAYNRAIELLRGAKIAIVWRDGEHICVRCGLRDVSWSREFRPGVDEAPF